MEDIRNDVIIKKQPKDRMLQTYDVLDVEGSSTLIAPFQGTSTGDSGITYYVTAEEVFDILYKVHMFTTDHGGRDWMCYELNRSYKNIAQVHVTFFSAVMWNVSTKKK